MSRHPFGTRHKSDRILEIIHSDICGPITPIAYDGSKYFITFIDDFSNFTVVYLLKHKSEAFSKFKEFYYMTKAMFGYTLSKLRCDNGGEYTSNEFRKFSRDNGVIMDYTVPYTPQQNGKAERKNRTLVERARAIINESEVPKELWGEAILCSNYVINRCPTESISIIPAEIWLGRRQNVSDLKVFGSTAYSHLRNGVRDKFDSKVQKCIMMGYAPNGYRLWDENNGNIIISRDVKFDEDCFFYKNKVSININKDEIEMDRIGENISVENEETSIEEIGIVDKNFRENKRKIKPPSKLNDYELYMAFDAMGYVDDVPQSFDELKFRDDKIFWKKAMERELESINKNETWEIVDKPINKKILDTKWVYTYKLNEEENEKYKARLVVRGFAQKGNVDYTEVYSPVAKMTTIRVLLTIGNQFGHYFRQLDVKTAFLNAKLNEEIYIYSPQGLNVGNHKVLKLNKSLYGLVQSSKCWNEEINNYLTRLGFVRSENDYCLYVLDFQGEKIYLLLYVDDIIVSGSNLNKINSIIEKLMNSFEIKNKGELRNFLGIEIEYDRELGILKLKQSKYINKLLNKFNMNDCKGIDTPIDQKLQILVSENDVMTEKPYRQLIGCLMYLMLGTRPDICFALNFFSRYQDKATDQTWFYLKRILRYIRKTQNVGLQLTRGDNLDLICFVDADWGSDVTNRKSSTGFLFKLFGNTIHWVTRKQNCVTLSTTEAELVALCSSVSEGLWLKKLLLDLDIDVTPIKFFEDNQACIALVKNPGNNRRVKHLDLKYNFVTEHLQKKNIVINYIETISQQADILTKGLQFILFTRFKFLLGLEDFSEGGC